MLERSGKAADREGDRTTERSENEQAGVGELG